MRNDLFSVLRRTLLLATATACGGTAIETLPSSRGQAPAEDAGAAPPARPVVVVVTGNGAPDPGGSMDAGDAGFDAGIDIDAGISCSAEGTGAYKCAGAGSFSNVHLRCDGQLTQEECNVACSAAAKEDAGTWSCRQAPDSWVYYDCWPVPCDTGGRRPEGFEATRGAHGSPVGAFFARLAELEAASVDAFEILARELAAHDAPALLQRSALRSARDEVRHARIAAALARRHGGTPRKPEIEHRGVRDLETIAIENAVEGCVRETFGALVAMAQAERASDPAIQKAMRRIAEDETRHAELSWAIASWAMTVLDEPKRSRVRAAMSAAVDDLQRDADRPVHPELVAVAGLPSSTLAKRMVAELRTALWSRAAA